MKGPKTVPPNFSHTNENKRVFMKEFHFHDKYELYFLMDGTTKYIIGNEVFRVQKGNFVFIPKGMLHKTDSEECLRNERILICFDDSIFTTDMLTILNDFSKNKLIYIEKNKIPILLDLLQKIQQENTNKSSDSAPMIRAYITELLILISRYRTIEQDKFKLQDKVIYDVSEYISDYFYEDIKVHDLSLRFSISEGHLSRRFKTVIGMGINEYIRYIRILNASNLLKKEDISITEIAIKCGFNDSNYFSTVFKKATGLTPKHYRQIYCPAI
ncbi:MAG: AraC family transcriptional regulator [Clostridia bacterium]|nr:AraC family transcriptional regulator [Clostridia bacterium]